MNIFVVGSNGFIGTNLVEKLEKDKKEDDVIMGVDICAPPYVDARKKNQITRFTRNADIVYHLANIPMHRLSLENPYRVIENNYVSTLSIAEAVRKSEKCKKIVFFSSFAVYGDHITPWDEETQVKATTPYGLCKIQSEMLLYAYHEWYGLDVIIIRPSNVFGPHEELHKPLQVIPQWFEDAKNNHPLVVYGEDTVRDWTHVYDVVRGTILASEKKSFEIYNLCNNNPIKLLDVAKYLSNNIIIKELSKHEISQWYGSFDKAKKELGWEPEYNLWSYLKKIRLNTN
jgi:UDP-glucose 4-epimerase